MLKDQIVVVTGGAGTLGKPFCRGIATAGGVPVVADIDLVAAQQVVAELAGEGKRAMAFSLDITRRDSVDALIAAVHSKLGRIDALVNNAYPRNPNFGRKFEDVAFADFCENVNTHLGGYFLVSQRFAEYFKTAGAGNIVSIASIYGALPPRFEIYDGTDMTTPVEYAATKAGVIQLMRYMASYYKSYGIRCNCLSPGGILQDQPPKFLEEYKKHCASKGMLEVSDVVGSLIFLLSSASRYVNGQNLIVDDGFSL